MFYKGIKIDCQYRCVVLENEEVKLTYSEFEILYLLANSPGRVFSKEQIYSNVWGESCIGDCSVIMSHIQNIRKKFEKEPGKALYIQTVWGVEYWFNFEVSRDFYYSMNYFLCKSIAQKIIHAIIKDKIDSSEEKL